MNYQAEAQESAKSYEYWIRQENQLICKLLSIAAPIKRS